MAIITQLPASRMRGRKIKDDHQVKRLGTTVAPALLVLKYCVTGRAFGCFVSLRSQSPILLPALVANDVATEQEARGRTLLRLSGHAEAHFLITNHTSHWDVVDEYANHGIRHIVSTSFDRRVRPHLGAHDL